MSIMRKAYHFAVARPRFSGCRSTGLCGFWARMLLLQTYYAYPLDGFCLLWRGLVSYGSGTPVRYYPSLAPVCLSLPSLSCRHQSRPCILELFRPAIGVLPKTGDAEPVYRGKPDWERLRIEDDLRHLNFGLTTAAWSASDRSTWH